MKDLQLYFKDLLSVDKTFQPDTALEKSGMDVYYWQLSDIKTLPNGLRYKSTFTFMYRNLEEALSDTVLAKKDGEWSFRLYGGFDGFSLDFVPIHKTVVDQMFTTLALSKWNSDKEIQCLLGN